MTDPATIRRLYGRRQGHKLREGQAALVEKLLPQVSVPATGPLDAPRLFGDARPLELEIGFGGGEHLVAQAAASPVTASSAASRSSTAWSPRSAICATPG